MKQVQIGGEFIPYTATHKGGTAFASGGTVIVVTPPAGTNQMVIRPEGAARYYQVNSGTASAASYGYAPQDNVDIIFAIDNMGSVAFYQASGTVHVQYYQSY